MWSPDHEVWLNLVVGHCAGGERSSREEESRKGRSCILNAGSEASVHHLELEGVPAGHACDSLEA